MTNDAKIAPNYIANIAENLYMDLVDESLESYSTSHTWLDNTNHVLTMCIFKERD